MSRWATRSAFILMTFGACFLVKVRCSDVGQEENEVKLAANCDNWLSCMNSELYSNITDIIASDEYKLTDNLYLEKFGKRESDDGALTTRRRLFTRKNAISSYVLLKKVLSLFETHALKYNLMSGLDLAVFRNVTEAGPKMAVALVTTEPQRAGRTFGIAVFRKRMMYILLAMTFKLGIMTTLLVTILVLVLKGLKIGVLLLVLTFGSVLAKWKLAGQPPQPWKNEDIGGKGIHVHIHNDAAQKQAYSGWTPEQFQPPITSYYHRKKDGDVHTVNEDPGNGYPAVFRPAVYKYPYMSYKGYSPVYPSGYSRVQENHREEDNYQRRSGLMQEDEEELYGRSEVDTVQ